MDVFSTFLNFFVNKSNKLTHKAIVLLSSIIIIAILDNTLSFSTSYTNIRKYEQIQAINSILSDTTLSKSEKTILKQKRFYTLNYKTWKDKTYQFLQTIDFNFSKPNGNIPVGDPTHPEVKPVEKEINIQRNYWIHYVTSSWTVVICMIGFPILIFFTEKGDIKGLILGLPFFELFFYVIGWIFAKALSFIPIIQNNVNYNYALNVVIHTAIIIVLGSIAGRYQKRKKEEKNKQFSK